jgi:hypothetical protein
MLNFVSYTKNFKLPNQTEGGAGITFSLINSGVTNIDGRDPDGTHTEDYSTSENQFLFAPSIRVSDKVSLGIGFKFYYSKLFKGVTTTSLGFDGGIIYKVSSRINVGFAIKDINSRYEWNTNEIYGTGNGAQTKDKFPRLHTLGISYLLPNNYGLRMGLEIKPIKDVSFRAGFDRFDFLSSDKFGNSSAMFGFGYEKNLTKYILGINYSFVMEQYSNKPFQTLTAVFKIK